MDNHSTFIENIPKLGKKPNIHQHVNDKQTVVYPDNGLVLSNKDRQTVITHVNRNKSQSTYAECKHPDTKVQYILCRLHLCNSLESSN